MLANDIPTTFLTCNMQRKRVWELLAQLALRSDISKLNCTGLKIDPFRNRWAYIAVFGLILKWKSQAIA